MDKNYWDHNSLISLTKDELSIHLEYEIGMFRDTCKYCRNFSSYADQTIKNFIVESLATHSRILIDFFYPEERQKVHINDIKIDDFVPLKVWLRERPPLTQNLFDARQKADKQLAHLSRWRHKLAKDNKKVWKYKEIYNELELVIEKFYKLLIKQ